MELEARLVFDPFALSVADAPITPVLADIDDIPLRGAQEAAEAITQLAGLPRTFTITVLGS